jgi:hypothetical protein
MILGKTVDDLNLQTRIEKITFLWWVRVISINGKVPGKLMYHGFI